MSGPVASVFKFRVEQVFLFTGMWSLVIGLGTVFNYGFLLQSSFPSEPKAENWAEQQILELVLCFSFSGFLGLFIADKRRLKGRVQRYLQVLATMAWCGFGLLPAAVTGIVAVLLGALVTPGQKLGPVAVLMTMGLIFLSIAWRLLRTCPSDDWPSRRG
jgi:hypothetical protein